MQLSGTYSNISDEELDELVRDAQRGHPGIGLRMLMGHMRSQRFRIQCVPCIRTPCTLAHRWQSQVDKVQFVLNNGFMLVLLTQVIHVARVFTLWV